MKRNLIISTYFVIVACALIAIVPIIPSHTNRIPMLLFFGTVFSLAYWVVATIILGSPNRK